MTRRECLDKAAECVLQDRASQYGGPEDNFGRIAKLWSTYTGTVLDGIDVAMMMALLKVARIRNNKAYSDGFIDLAGYAACGAELAGAEKAREDATRRWGEEYRRLRAKAEGDAKAEGWEELVMADAEEVEKAFGKPDGGCCQNGKDHAIPGFKPGDMAQAFNGEEWVDCRYIRWNEPEGRHVVQYEGCTCSIDPEMLRPVPRAEGCEALVEKDAPQTPQELYNRIIANNPATFKAHKPTGEELAEMAEEEKHG